MEILSNWVFWACIIGAVVQWKLVELAKGAIDRARDRQQGVIDGLWSRISKLESEGVKDREFIGRPDNYKWSDPSLQTQINVLADKHEKAVENGIKNWRICQQEIKLIHSTYQTIIIDHAKALDALESKVKELQEAKGSQCTAEKPAPPKASTPPPGPNPTSSRRTR